MDHPTSRRLRFVVDSQDYEREKEETKNDLKKRKKKKAVQEFISLYNLRKILSHSLCGELLTSKSTKAGSFAFKICSRARTGSL